MHLRHCRGVAPALFRLRSHDVAVLQHAVRSFHISARCNDESSGSNGPGNSARARSQVAGAQIQNLPRTGASPIRTISPSRNANNAAPSGQRILAPRVQTPRVLTRVGGGPGRSFPGGGRPGGGRPGGFGPRSGGPGGGNRGGPRGGRPQGGGAGGGPRRRGRMGGRDRKKDEDKDTTGGVGLLSPPMLEYLLSLKAKRRMVRTYTPHDATKAELAAQSSRSATLGQPGGAAALLDARLRELADRKLPNDEAPPITLQARRLANGQFVKFADERERKAVLELVAAHQVRKAARLSEKKGEEIAPRPIEFEEVAGETREKTTKSIITGAYEVRARGAEPVIEGQGDARVSSRDFASRMIDLNGSYVGGDAEKFMGRLRAVLGVQGAAASNMPKTERAAKI